MKSAFRSLRSFKFPFQRLKSRQEPGERAGGAVLKQEKATQAAVGHVSRATRSLWYGFEDKQDRGRLVAVHLIQAAVLVLLLILTNSLLEWVADAQPWLRPVLAIPAVALLMFLHRAASRAESKSAAAWASGAVVLIELSLLVILFPVFSNIATSVVPARMLDALGRAFKGDGFQLVVFIAILIFSARGWGRFVHRAVAARQAHAQAQWYRRLAYEDVLTGLPNRRAFEEEVDRRLRQDSRPLVVLVIDVDHFKRVNDTWSHEVGDRALVAVARALEASVGRDGHVARLAGDEFVVALWHDAEAAVEVQQRVAHAGRAITVRIHDGTSIEISISVGAACAQAGDTLTSLLHRGDLEMYKVKHALRNAA